jgi:murein DD-endopeptidase MepM/ murein hydrolase activator NlpD
MRTTLLAFALVLAGMSGSLQASTSAATHVVRKGETAARIARSNGLSLAELRDLNPKAHLDRLARGTVLRVASGRPEPARAGKAGRAGKVEPLYTNERLIRTFVSAPALPATPAIGTLHLVHMEGMLVPSLPQSGAVAQEVPGEPEAFPLSGIRPVLSANGESDLFPAPPAEPSGFLPADPARLDLLWPVETRTISSAWGPRMRSRVVRVKTSRRSKRRIRYRGSHKGLDLTAPQGTDVFAVLDGRVVAAGRHKDYGNFVTVDHGNGVLTLYGHHRANYVQVGELVHRGQKIAEVGRTGNATGPHLHFELRVNGVPRNPLPVLNDSEEIPADMLAQNRTVTAPSRRR